MFFFIHLHQILYTEFMKRINWVLLIVIPLLWAACSKDDKMNIEKSRIDSLKNIQFETEQFADVQIGNDDLPVDRVSGYTLNQIQSSLKTSRTVNDFFTRLRSMHNNPTEDNLQPIQDYANTIVNSL